MRDRYKALTIIIGLAVVLMLAQVLVGQAPPAQGGGAAPAGGRGQAPGGGRGGAPAVPAGPVIRTPDGKPDFTGYWMAATKTNINKGRGGIVNPDKKNADGTVATDAKIRYNAAWEG